MKKLIFIFTLFTISTSLKSQDFTWLKGSTTAGAAGIYGTQNVPASGNTPGERHGSATWVDLNGNLWMFGGEAPSNSWWNDLWKYNITTNEWTWINGSNTPNAQGVYGTQGVSAPTNQPGAREFAISWTDASGNFWMFGGDGPSALVSPTLVRFGDLWKYDPLTNEWTWMKGFNTYNQPGVYGTQGVTAPTNLPSSRGRGVGLTDGTGNLWLFGGTGHTTSTPLGRLNDLWKYNISTNEWTWMSGDNTLTPYGVYGTISVPSITNRPGGREFPACWLDASGNFWLFGGQGRDASVTPFNFGMLNDLWKYNIASNTWAWITGPNTIDALPAYGTQGFPAPSNIPGSRNASAYWQDASGNFWLFGGKGFSSTTFSGQLNDLWRYNPVTNQWAWMKGSTLIDQNGTYGTQGVAASTNIPGGREYPNFWKDLTGKFWLFGGEGFDATSTTESHMDDLWSYIVPCNPDTILSSSGNVVCSGSTVTLTAINGGTNTIWYNSPVSTNSISVGAMFTLPSHTVAGTPSIYTYYAEQNACTVGLRPFITITVVPNPSLTLTPTNPTICAGSSATITASGALNYYWTTISSTISTTVQVLTPTITTSFPVIGEDANGCKDTVTITQYVNPKPSLTLTPTNPTVCAGSPATITASGALNYYWMTISSTISTTVQVLTPTITTSFPVIGEDANGCKDTVTVVQYVNPSPTLLATADRTIACRNETVTLNVSGATSYTWNVSPSTVGTTISVTNPLSTTVLYTVTGSDSNNCSNSTTVSVKYVFCEQIGVKEINKDEILFLLYPNPSKGEFTIKTDQILEGSKFCIINALGEKVYSQTLNADQNSIKVDLIKGVYFYVITDKNQRQSSGKLIIE